MKRSINITKEFAFHRLKLSRIEAGFKTAKDFAKEIQTPQSTYRSYENGTRKLSIFIAKQYATILNIDWKWLYYGNNTKPLVNSTLNLKDHNPSMYEVDIPFIDYKSFTNKTNLALNQNKVKIPTLLLNQHALCKHKHLFLSQALTNNLTKYINYNDFILIDTSYNKALTKGIYLVFNNGVSYLTLAYLVNNKKIVLENSYGTVTVLLQSVEILGKVIWLSKPLD